MSNLLLLMKSVSYYITLVITDAFDKQGLNSLIKDTFDKYLFHYFFKDIYKVPDIFELDPFTISVIKRYFPESKDDSCLFEVLDSELALVCGILKEDFDEANFSFENLASKYGNIKFKCLLQPKKSEVPVPFFDEEMDIKNYVKYSNTTKSVKQLKFACNIDMDNNFNQLKENLKSVLPDVLQWRSIHDILQYSPKTNQGINEPQLYLKVKNVWTGAHDETLCLRSVNCNHGPGASFWIGTQTEDDNTMMDKALKIEGIDFYNQKHQFFPSIEFCLKNKIKVTCGVQYAHDIVVVGPGSRHW